MIYSDCRKAPDKIAYASRNTAETRAHIRSVLQGTELRVYECLRAHGGCGSFHITSKAPSPPQEGTP